MRNSWLKELQDITQARQGLHRRQHRPEGRREPWVWLEKDPVLGRTRKEAGVRVVVPKGQGLGGEGNGKCWQELIKALARARPSKFWEAVCL